MLEAHIIKQLRDFKLDLSLNVENGSILAMMGENGAGKSTTLNIISGLLDADAGSIRFNGLEVLDTAAEINIPVEDRRIGYVFQKSAIFPHMNVWDNVAFGLRARHSDTAVIREQVTHWLGRMNMASLAGVSAARLSGGQKQRVALARALATKPALLMLDEPFAGLDVESSRSVKEIVRRCVSELCIPCLLVTHQREDAEEIADNACILNRGSVIWNGNAAEIV